MFWLTHTTRPGIVPAQLALFSIRQGMRNLLPRDSSCQTSFILIPAGYEKLSWGQGEHLPNKLKRKNGRVLKACRPGKAPALHTLFLIRQGSESLPAMDRPCPIHFLYKRHGKPKQQALSDSEQQAQSGSKPQTRSGETTRFQFVITKRLCYHAQYETEPETDTAVQVLTWRMAVIHQQVRTRGNGCPEFIREGS